MVKKDGARVSTHSIGMAKGGGEIERSNEQLLMVDGIINRYPL